jgi:hypothetical protein
VALLATICSLIAVAGAGAVATPPFQLVMSGLDNPRGLAWGPEGALYVAEAGTGGPQACFGTPRGPAFVGFTGAVSRLWNGLQERVATGLPSYRCRQAGTGNWMPMWQRTNSPRTRTAVLYQTAIRTGS